MWVQGCSFAWLQPCSATMLLFGHHSLVCLTTAQHCGLCILSSAVLYIIVYDCLVDITKQPTCMKTDVELTTAFYTQTLP